MDIDKEEVIICVGISGSGKSSWTTNFVKNNENYYRVNRDSIRLSLIGTLDDYYQRKDLQYLENKIIEDVEAVIFERIWNGNSIIVDNTNLKQSYINRWIKEAGPFPFRFKLFDVELEEAKDRIACRDFPIDIPLDYPALDYINKQYKNYLLIKDWIIKNYKDKIIENE